MLPFMCHVAACHTFNQRVTFDESMVEASRIKLISAFLELLDLYS